MYIKRTLVLFWFLSILQFVNAQSTLTVTQPTLDGTPGSLETVIANAITLANAGNNVIVEFNVPAGLVSIDQALPVINISAGSITFIKSSAVNVIQGIKFNALPTNLSVKGIIIEDNYNSSIYFKDLTFENFIDEQDDYYHVNRAGIEIKNGSNVYVGGSTISEQCIFKENGVLCESTNGSLANINIINNKFQVLTGNNNQGVKIWCKSPGSISNTTSINISNNNFYNGHIGIQAFIDAAYLGTIVISNNDFQSTYRGIHFINLINPGNGLSINILDNDFSNNLIGVREEGMHSNWIFNNNTFVNNNVAVESFSSISDNCGMKIIKGGSVLGYLPFNQNNIFTSSSSQYIIRTMNSIYNDKIELIKNSFPASIDVLGGAPVIIRENTIVAGIQNLPIHLDFKPGIPIGNFGIIPPNFICGYIELFAPQELHVKLIFPYSLDQFNPNFAVDFYKSNANGDLLDYLGHYDFNSNTQYQHDVIISLPSSVSLQTGDRIAATLTSLGDGSLPAMGTSEASYYTVADECTFIVNPNSACVGESIHFNTSIIGSDVTYNWEFYDLAGQLVHTSTVQNPQYSYSIAGTYNVILIVHKPGYPDITTSSQIIINNCCPNEISILTNPTICLNELVQFTSSLGSNPNYTYLWDFGDGTTSTQAQPLHYFSSNLSWYWVQVWASNNTCSLHITIDVNISNAGQCNNCNMNLGINVTGAHCGCDGSLTAVPLGAIMPVTYQWSNGATTPTISSLCSGSEYSVTVTDANNCTAIAQETVTFSGPVLGMTITPYNLPASCAQSCNGEIAVSISGGSPPYTYLWSNGDTDNHLTGACANTPYSVTVTGHYGCVQVGTYSVGASSVNCCNMQLTLSPTNAHCQCDGAVNLTVGNANGSVSYLWSNGATTQDLTNVCGGNTYNVTVTDGIGCSSNTGVYVGSSVLSYTVNNTNALCVGACNGAITLFVSGGASPYNFNWSNGAAGSSVTDLCAGSVYSVTITDQNGCNISHDFTVGVDYETCCKLNSTISHSNVSCTVQGSASVITTSGYAPFTYLWSTGSTASFINNLSQGYYSVTVTDSINCSKELSVYVDSICGTDTCDNCITSFSPLHEHKYIVTAWVKQENSEGILNYTYPSVSIYFTGVNVTVGPFYASGEIIDGWQRIEGIFVIPLNAEKIVVKLNNGSALVDALFDDIRIQPYNATMKSFVYDPIHLRVMAESDENNYATFYEYDEEGALVRVKKETVRGVLTIKESRNNTKKELPGN